jgi:tetratricopeptide (TPR) repeat protein
MQLTLIDQLQAHQGQLSAVDQLRFVQLRGRALADAGQQVAALQVFKQLAADHPRSGSIQETYGELLSAVDNPGSRQQALQQWRRVAQHSPPKSTRWYRAKYQVAMTYFRLGQPEQTAARLRYLQATSGWEDSGMKAQFEALLKRSQP